MAQIWLICNQCGHNILILEHEVIDYGECGICGGKMILDYDKKTQEKEDTIIGDNFPQIPDREKEMAEQEVKNNINILGESHCWYLIEALSDVELRLRYRAVFFKLGGQIPIKDEDREDLK